jgi:hypothetical protein
MDGFGRLFGEVFGEVFDFGGERAGEAMMHTAAEGAAEGMRPDRGAYEMTRYLAGGPRTLNINDR